MTNVSFFKVQLNIPILFIVSFFLIVPVDTNGKNSHLDNEIELTFSHKRDLYEHSFELIITANNAGAEIIYTLDCSRPSQTNGIIYSDGIQIDSTIVVKAIALSANGNSRVYTNSYLFPASSAKQGKEPEGFPKTWGGSSIIAADYEMDPEVIFNPDYSSEINSAFNSILSLSLSMDVDEWFNPSTGLYVGYPNSNETREKQVTAEFIFNDTEENFAVECGVQNQGGTSIVKWKIPKQSMRLLFKEMYGPKRLHYKLFPNSEINSINTLVVDGLLYSWLHPWDEKQRNTSLYFRDQLASDMQNEMGWLSFHGRYVHLYLNGLYWGLYDLHERPDDAFLSEYLDAEREDFDVVKHNPNDIVSGSNEFYLEMLARAREGLSTEKGLQDIQKYLDLPAFIDYMLLNFYLGNYDWAHQNYYAARNRIKQTGFRFYTWDAEHIMRYSKVDYNNTKKNDEGGPTEIHTLLKKNAEYRMMFADAVYKHCFNDGVLTPENFEKSFLFRKNEIEEAIILESARWGDYLQEELDTTYTKNEFWVPEVNKVLEAYIPQRRDIVIGQFRDVENNLFPNYMPPVFEIDKRSTELQKIVKLVNPNSSNGNIYFTIDGTDPRRVGGAIQGTKYSEPVEIGYSTILKARFYSQADYTWSALAEKSFLFDDVFGENVVIDEIMYNPETDYPEFIELVNAGDAPVHLQGFTFSEGIEYSFKNGESIQPGAGLVLTNDTALFKSVYKFKASSQYQKRLSNGGETILLKNGLNQLVDSVTYTDTVPWPELADGDGYSLELIDTGLDNALPSSWRASAEIYGSPYNAETKLDLNVEMYPNPFNDGFNIVLYNPELANGNFTIDVFNAQGSKIKRFVLESYNSSIRINMGDIKPGLYIIRIISANNNKFKSVVLILLYQTEKEELFVVI